MSVIDPTRAIDPDALTPKELEPAEADPAPDDPAAKLMAEIEELRKTDPAAADKLFKDATGDPSPTKLAEPDRIPEYTEDQAVAIARRGARQAREDLVPMVEEDYSQLVALLDTADALPPGDEQRVDALNKAADIAVRAKAALDDSMPFAPTIRTGFYDVESGTYRIREADGTGRSRVVDADEPSDIAASSEEAETDPEKMTHEEFRQWKQDNPGEIDRLLEEASAAAERNGR